MIRKKYLRGLLRAVIIEKGLRNTDLESNSSDLGSWGLHAGTCNPSCLPCGVLGAVLGGSSWRLFSSFIPGESSLVSEKNKRHFFQISEYPLESPIGVSRGPRKDLLS